MISQRNRRYRVTGAATTFGGVFSSLIAVGLAAGAAQAVSSPYTCPLQGSNICSDPFVGTPHGSAAPDTEGYSFDLTGSDVPGYIQVAGSSQVPMNNFPISVSVWVKGVGVPSRTVGDYDVVRGTVVGNWKIEVMAKNGRTTARAACHFKGPSGKALVIGGPDLSTMKDQWTKITCTDTGTSVDLYVGDSGTPDKSVSVRTGSIPNPGGLLIGAKDVNGADQFSGYAKDVEVSVP